MHGKYKELHDRHQNLSGEHNSNNQKLRESEL